MNVNKDLDEIFNQMSDVPSSPNEYSIFMGADMHDMYHAFLANDKEKQEEIGKRIKRNNRINEIKKWRMVKEECSTESYLLFIRLTDKYSRYNHLSMRFTWDLDWKEVEEDVYETPVIHFNPVKDEWSISIKVDDGYWGDESFVHHDIKPEQVLEKIKEL